MATSLAITGLCAAAGAGMGSAMGRTRSCTDGGCPLTANPKRGALWGGFLGLILGLSLIPGGATLASGGKEGKETKSAYTEVSTADAFKKEVLDYSGTALVYFHASWCGACRQFEPVAEKVARDHAGEAHFVKVDTDKANALAAEYKIEYLPTTIVFAKGVEKQRIVGAVPENEVTKALSDAVGKKEAPDKKTQ